MGFQNILFDLDGTLTDSGPGIINSVAYALDKMGIDFDRNNLSRFVGPPLWDSFEIFCGLTKTEADQAVSCYREYYADRGIFENTVYPGIVELLDNLTQSGKSLFVATSKPEHFAKIVLDHFDLSKYFQFIGGSEMGGGRATKSEVITYVLEKGKINAADSVMVGDREHDIIGAKANNLKSIGVLFGYGSKEELLKAGADYICGTADEIFRFVQ